MAGIAPLAALLALLAAGAVGASIPPHAGCAFGELSFDESAATEWLEAAGRAGGDAPDAAAELGRAMEFLRHCNPPAAANAFRQANELAGGVCGGCLLGAAQALGLAGLLDPAIEGTRAAIALLDRDPLLGRAWGQLGTLLLLRQTPEGDSEAEDAFATAAEAGGSYHAMALSRLAAVRLQRRHYPEAVETALRAIAADPHGEAGGGGRSTICRARRAGYTDELARRGAPAADQTNTANTAPEREETYRVGEGVQRPTRIYSPAPLYPAMARKARLQGVVIVEGVIDTHGCVADEKVLKGLPMGLDEATVAAVQGWVFEPATLDGKPVRVYYTLTINFQMAPDANLPRPADSPAPQ
ncbi:MAG TPA: energy transducer TonB [Thermoanaerobaculia bacterium]|nr:energy transducer TonB [Thermoanaerobaculia bacterium]